MTELENKKEQNDGIIDPSQVTSFNPVPHSKAFEDAVNDQSANAGTIYGGFDLNDVLEKKTEPDEVRRNDDFERKLLKAVKKGSSAIDNSTIKEIFQRLDQIKTILKERDNKKIEVLDKLLENGISINDSMEVFAEVNKSYLITTMSRVDSIKTENNIGLAAIKTDVSDLSANILQSRKDLKDLDAHFQESILDNGKKSREQYLVLRDDLDRLTKNFDKRFAYLNNGQNINTATLNMAISHIFKIKGWIIAGTMITLIIYLAMFAKLLCL